MKYFEREYYEDTIGGCMGSIEPIESWLKDKDVVFRGRKRAIKRHRRSITSRTLKRICGYTCFREEAHKCRLFVY